MRNLLLIGTCLGCWLLGVSVQRSDAQDYRESRAPYGMNGYVYESPRYYSRVPTYSFWGFPNSTTWLPPAYVLPAYGYPGTAYRSEFGPSGYGGYSGYRGYGYPAYGYYSGIGPGPDEFLRFGGADFYGW